MNPESLLEIKLDLWHKSIVKKRELTLRNLLLPIVRLEFICMLLDFAYYMDFKLYQMDVKSAFLNGYNREGVCNTTARI